MTKVKQVLYQMAFAFHPELIPEMLAGYAKVFAVILLGFLLHWLPSAWKKDLQDYFRHAPDFAKATAIVLLALLLFQLKTSESQPFIYFQF